MNAPLWEQSQLNKCRQKHAYYDEELRDFGARPPEPTLGQSKRGYQRKALSTIQRSGIPQINKLSQIDLYELDGTTIDALEPQIVQAYKDHAEDPSATGVFRQITKRNPYGQVTEYRFIGPWTGKSYVSHYEKDEYGVPKPVFKQDQECFIKGMNRPGRRIWSWCFPKGSTDPAGRPVPDGYRYPDGRPMPVAQTLLGAGYSRAA
jgi:hypothetical protein